MTFAGTQLRITNNTPSPIKATVRLDGEIINVTLDEVNASSYAQTRDDVLRSFGLPPTIYGKPVVVEQPALTRLAALEKAVDELRAEVAANGTHVVAFRGCCYVFRNDNVHDPVERYDTWDKVPQHHRCKLPLPASATSGCMVKARVAELIREGKLTGFIERNPGEWITRCVFDGVARNYEVIP